VRFRGRKRDTAVPYRCPQRALLFAALASTNLKNIDVSIDHNSLTVVTGVSAPANLRWPSIPSMPRVRDGMWSRYPPMRGSFWKRIEEARCRPDRWHRSCRCDPAEKHYSQSPPTVATATEIYDYLRLLFARVGRTFCLKCGQEVERTRWTRSRTRSWQCRRRRVCRCCFPCSPSAARPADTEKKKGRRRKKVESEEARLPSDLLKSRLLDLRRRRHQLWRLQLRLRYPRCRRFPHFHQCEFDHRSTQNIFDSRSLVEFKGPVCLIPPNSFAWAVRLSTSAFRETSSPSASANPPMPVAGSS